MKGIKSEIRSWIEFFLRNLPGKSGFVLRRLYWQNQLSNCNEGLSFGTYIFVIGPERISIGRNANIMSFSRLSAHNGGNLVIGDNFSCNSNTKIDAAEHGVIIIGDNVLIGPNVVIRASNHNYKRKDMPINKQGHNGGKILIEDDVWIASNVTIVPGVKIAKGAVIAAGAVVTTNIPSYSLAGGVPAKTIKKDIRR